MNLDEFINGISILKKYYNDPKGYHLGAEHDIFYMYPTDKPISEEEFNSLQSFGWFQDEVEKDDDGVQLYADYDKEKGWAAYV